jgi:hypothetical protein
MKPSNHIEDPESKVRETTTSSNPVRDIVKRLFPEILDTETGSIENIYANQPDESSEIDNTAVIALVDRLWEESVHKPNFSKSVSRIASP